LYGLLYGVLQQISSLESMTKLLLRSMGADASAAVNSSGSGVDGHPNEFILGVLRGALESSEEMSVLDCESSPRDSVREGDSYSGHALKQERDFELLVLLNVLVLWPHNAGILTCDNFAVNVSKLVENNAKRLNAVTGFTESAVGAHTLNFLCGGILIMAQFIARCSPSAFVSNLTSNLIADDMSTIPENPWDMNYLRTIQCEWVPEYIRKTRQEGTVRTKSRFQGVMLPFNVLSQLLLLCDRLEEAFAGYIVLNNDSTKSVASSATVAESPLPWLRSGAISVAAAQCEILYGCNRVKNSSINPKESEAITASIRNLADKFLRSNQANHLLQNRQVLANQPLGGLIVRRGTLLVDLNTKLHDVGFSRSVSYEGIAADNLAAYIRWLNDFVSARVEGSYDGSKYFQQYVRFAIPSESTVNTIESPSLLKNLSISCEYPQEFRLSRCSVDFWPWRGQKLSAELGTYAEDIAIDDGDDVMQEMKIDEFNGRRYRMCCVSNAIGAGSGIGSRSVSDELLLTARQLVMHVTGAYSVNANIVNGLFTSILTVPKLTRDLVQDRLVHLMRCSEAYLTVVQTTTTGMLCPDFQLHVVGALHKILLQWPKETISACRNSNFWSMLLGPFYFGGGDVELSQMFTDSAFYEDRVKRSTKITMKLWSVKSSAQNSSAALWKGACAYGWMSLKDAILDLMCDVVQFSCSQNIGPTTHEILQVMSLLKRPAQPNTVNLATVYQTTRWLRHVVHPEFRGIERSEKYKLGKLFLVDVMVVIAMHLEIVGLARQQTMAGVLPAPGVSTTVASGISSNSNSSNRDSVKINSKLIWPARASVVDFLLCLSTVEFFPRNLDWITLFLEKSSSSSSSSRLHDNDLSVADSDTMSNIAGAGNTAGPVSTSRMRLKTLESLLLDPRCRAASMRIISRLISVYAVEMTMANDNSGPHAIPTPTTVSGSPNGNTDSPNLKQYTFDVVGRIMSVVSFTINNPTSVDSYNCSLLCLRTLTWMLRAKKFLLLRQSIQYIFRNSDCMNSTLQSIISILKPNEIKASVLDSSERWLLSSIVKQGLALLTCIMANNDSNKNHFSKLVMFGTNTLGAGRPNLINQIAQVESVESSPALRKRKQPTVSFEHFAMLLLETEGSISLEVVIVLFDMMLEVPCIRNRSVLSEPNLLTQGMFANDDDRPKIRNAGVIIMIISLVTTCSIPIQRFILQTFSNLVRGRASLANLTICSQSKPNLLDLSLDLFPVIPATNLPVLVQLVQCLGRHSISVAQLKHVFRIMQGDGGSCPSYNQRVLESLQGMISNDSAPFHTFVFEGDESGLRLPPIFQWPAKNGFSFCLWFQVESPKGTGERVDASECGDEESNSNNVLIYEPHLLSMRSSLSGPGIAPNGPGIEVSLRMVGPNVFKPMVKLYSTNNESCVFDADSSVKEGEWHFLAVSVAGVSDWTNWTMRQNSGAFIIVDTSCKKQALTVPFSVQDPIFMPMIGSTPAASITREMSKAQTSFRGQVGAIYMFSDAIPAAKLMSIQELGPSYQYNFETFTADYKDMFLPSKITSAALQQSSNALSVLDGSLTQSIMLSYNPAVWGNDLVLDNTPSRNGIRWHVGSYANFVLEQGITTDDKGYYKMNARARKGTYHTKSQDIRMALDSLGGIKTVFPLFSQFDQLKQIKASESSETIKGQEGDAMVSNAEDTKSISYWVFSLLSTLVRDAAARHRDVKALSVLSYLMESVSASHLTLDVLIILKVIYHNLTWNTAAQDIFLETIFTNFKLWKNCSPNVQLDLFRTLADMVKDQYSRIKDFLSIQKILDALLCYYDYVIPRSPSLDDSVADLGSPATVPSLASDGDRVSAPSSPPPSPDRSESVNYSSNSISFEELKEIRFLLWNMLHSLYSKPTTFSRDDVPTLVNYVCSSRSPLSQLEGLQLLLQLLLNPQVSPKVIGGLGIGSCMSLLAHTTSSTSSSVRLYSLLVICRCFVICTNSSAARSQPVRPENTPVSPTSNIGMPNTGSDSWSMMQDDMNSSFISSENSNSNASSFAASALASSRFAVARAADNTWDQSASAGSSSPPSYANVEDRQQQVNSNSHIDQTTAFEDLGVPPDTLVGFIAMIEENLISALKSSSLNSTVESQIIAVLFQMTMFGVRTTYDEIIAAIHWLDSGTNHKVPFMMHRRSNSAVDSEVTCAFKPVDPVNSSSSSVATITFQLTSDVFICIPMVFVALMNFVREDVISADLRLSVLLNLRAAVSTSDNNIDTILQLPFWQNCVIEILASETSKCQSLGKDSSRLQVKTKTVCDVCLRLLCDLQVAAIRIGKPVGTAVIRRKHEVIAPSDIIDTLKKISKGERNLGVSVLRETMSYLRIIGGNVSSLNSQEIGFMLLEQTLSALKREQEMLEQKKETTKDAYFEKLHNLNIWLVVSVVLDFITCPIKKLVPLEDKAKDKEESQSYELSLPNTARSDLSDADVSLPQPSSPTSQGNSVTFAAISEPSLTRQNSSNALGSVKQARSRTLSSISAGGETAASSSPDSSTNDLLGSARGKRGRSSVYIASHPTFAISRTDAQGQDVFQQLVEGYSLSVDNILQLLDLIFKLLSKFMSTDTATLPNEDRMFLMTATANIGIYTGAKLITKIVDAVDNMITVPRNPSDSKMSTKALGALGALKKTPLMSATGGVSWIMIRVISSVLCKKGFITSDESKSNWCISPMTMVAKLQSWMTACEHQEVDFTYFEFLYVCTRLIEMLRGVEASEMRGSESRIRAVVELVVRLVIKYRSSFYEIMESFNLLPTSWSLASSPEQDSFVAPGGGVITGRTNSMSAMSFPFAKSSVSGAASSNKEGGLVSRLMASLPRRDNNAVNINSSSVDDDSIGVRVNNVMFDANSSFVVSEPQSGGNTPFKSMRSAASTVLASGVAGAASSINLFDSESVIYDCMTLFDVNMSDDNDHGGDDVAPFRDLLLRILNVALSNDATVNFSSNNTILSWENWDKMYELISTEAKSMQDDSLHHKLNDQGFQSYLSELYEEFDNSRKDFFKLVHDWSILSEHSLSRASAQQQFHQTERVRNEDSARRRLASRWSAIVAELANERGPWGHAAHGGGSTGQGHHNNEVFWMLETRENGRRQRPRLKRNIFGSRHLMASRRRQGTKKGSSMAVTTGDQQPSTPREQSSVQDIWKDLVKYKRTNSTSTVGDENAIAVSPYMNQGNKNGDNDNSDNEDDDAQTVVGSVLSSALTSTTASYDTEVLFTANVDIITIASNSTGGRSSGTIEVTRSKITFTRSEDQIESPTGYANNEYSWVTQGIPNNTSWQCSEIYLLFQRTYLLQFTAIEIMLTNRTSVFFNLFSEPTAKKLYRCIQHRVRPPYLQVLGHRNPEKAVRSALQAGGTQLVLTNAWMQRQISNFDYIMSLNTVAGRTFNDLGQYPIFPWVIVDYTSPRLDLTKASTFRNFKYAIGAQTEAQRASCQARYRDANEMFESNPAMEFPPFHHGTHYSCMGFVYWYLLRLEPFTSLHVWLQDGKFDHPDRLFTSIPDAWSGTVSNHNDVKELIPEFFYLPEFLENVNSLDLGASQVGERVGDVKLPPWARDPLEFIRLNRDALESEYVSANLHQWIDLIFGYKQRPPTTNFSKGHKDAIEDCNVFFHLTYSDAVNLEEMKAKDYELYERTIRQIDNYGQTPNRLFDRPHPQRRPLSKVKVIWPIASIILGIDTIANKDEMPELPKRIMCFNEEKVTCFPILFIAEIRTMKRLVTVDASRMIGYHQFMVRQPDVVPPYSLKIDSAALKISMGQQSQENWFGFSSKVPREYFVGVPFSSLELNSTKRRLLFTAQTQGVNLIGKDDNKQAMIKKEQERERARGRSTSSVTSHTTVSSSGGALSARSHNESTSTKSGRHHRGDPRGDKSVSSQSRIMGTSPPSPSAMPASSGSASLSSLPDNSSSASPRSKKSKSDHLYDNLLPHLFAVIPDTKLLFSCGHWDNSFKVTQVDTGKLVQSVIAHSDVVTCLAIASDFGQHWLVTGSRDCTVMVWDIYPDRPNPVSGNPVVLYGHDDTVTCISVCAELDIVVSGSDDGTITIYSLREGTYIRSIVLDSHIPDVIKSTGTGSLSARGHSQSFSLPDATASIPSPAPSSTAGSGPSIFSGVPLLSSKVEVHMVCVSRENYLIVYASDSTKYLLYCYTVNGRFVDKIELTERLTCIILSEDSRVLLTGGERCLVVMRWVHNLQLAKDGPRMGQEAVLDGKEGDQGPFGSPIRSLYLTSKERHLIVGLESGDIRILAQVLMSST
jgi:hypothetical protein